MDKSTGNVFTCLNQRGCIGKLSTVQNTWNVGFYKMKIFLSDACFNKMIV